MIHFQQQGVCKELNSQKEAGGYQALISEVYSIKTDTEQGKWPRVSD